MADVGSQLNQILERVAEIQKTITFDAGDTSGSITDAFPYPVTNPSIANTPFFYNEFNGGPTKIAAVTGAAQITSNIDMVLCVASVESETSREAIYRMVAFWRDAVVRAFAQKLRLGGDLAFVLQAQLTEVSGFQEISTESETKWGAVTFTLSVSELFPLTITA